MGKIRASFFLFSLLFTVDSKAEYLPWSTIEKKFQEKRIDTKALSHVQCFFEKYENRVFQKKVSYSNITEDRCGGSSDITLDSKRFFALIDYTVESNHKRMFLVDRQTGKIDSMGVAHGRYKANMINMKLSKNKNTIRNARYFSNEFNSNAPSSGFFVSGVEYQGKFGRSMVLHGLEDGINDNACERAVVVHKHLMVTNSAAFILSSGCPMISKNNINHVVNLLKGNIDTDSGRETNGSVVFIYGQRELNWEESTCNGNFSI